MSDKDYKAWIDVVCKELYHFQNPLQQFLPLIDLRDDILDYKPDPKLSLVQMGLESLHIAQLLQRLRLLAPHIE